RSLSTGVSSVALIAPTSGTTSPARPRQGHRQWERSLEPKAPLFRGFSGFKSTTFRGRGAVGCPRSISHGAHDHALPRLNASDRPPISRTVPDEFRPTSYRPPRAPVGLCDRLCDRRPTCFRGTRRLRLEPALRERAADRRRADWWDRAAGRDPTE